MKCCRLANAIATRSHPKEIESEGDGPSQEEADHERVVWWNIAAMMQKTMHAAEKY